MIRSALFFTCLLVLALSMLRPPSAKAQANSRFTHTTASVLNSGQQPARDFWFTIAQIYDAGGANGKYYMLYVTSQSATIVNVRVAGSSIQKFPIQKEQVVTFKIPLIWEVTSSGVIENKGIHVWSDDADLSCYLLSRNPASSDGMYIIPTVGWGKEYVVASYSSLFDLSFDYPSEFSIISGFDGTQATVAPSWDIRANHQPSSILHSRKEPFIETLLQGQCVQYQLTQSQNPDDWDVTGSIITSNKPLGVVGASQCANIPPDFAYCGHVCDMIPPVRTWGYNYYSLPFALRRGGDSFRAIASSDGQSIFMFDKSGVRQFAGLNKYQFQSEGDIVAATHWYSDRPFLLIQYINSTTWPDGTGALNAGIGAPSMVVLNSAEQFASHYLFQTPTILGGQNSYQNFVNIIVPKHEEQSTVYDNVLIDSVPGGTKIVIDTKFDGYQFVNQSPGTHTVASTQPLGGYVYGYGANDSYAWPISLATNSHGVIDAIPPAAKESNSCLCSRVTISDTNLSAFAPDSLVNISYTIDSTYQIGLGTRTSYYDICVINPDSAAEAVVSAYDIVGNRTQIKSSYNVSGLKFEQNMVAFRDSVLSVKVHNVGKTEYDLTGFQLLNGHNGFTIEPLPSKLLQPGDSALIKITYSPSHSKGARDTLELRDSCKKYDVALVGDRVEVLFISSDTCVSVGDSAITTLQLVNGALRTITVTSINFIDPHFHLSNVLPITIPAGQSVNIDFMFTPTDSITYSTSILFVTSGNDTVSGRLARCGKIVKAGVEFSALSNNEAGLWLSGKDASAILLLPVHPNPANGTNGKTVTFTIGLRERAGASLKLYDLLGREVATVMNDLWHPEGIFDVRFNTATLSPGSYIYRFEALGESRSGRLVISK